MGSCDIPVKDHQYDFACSHQKYLLSRAEHANWNFVCEYFDFLEGYAFLQKKLRRALTLEEQTKIRKEIEECRKEMRRLYPWDKMRNQVCLTEVQMYRYKGGRHRPH